MQFQVDGRRIDANPSWPMATVEKFADTDAASFQIDPQWEARNNRDVAALTAAVTKMQNAMMSNLAQQAASRASQERASVVSRGKSFDVMAGSYMIQITRL